MIIYSFRKDVQLSKITNFFINSEDILNTNESEQLEPIFSKDYLITEEYKETTHSNLSELISEKDIDENVLNKISAYIDQQISKSIQEVFINHQIPNPEDIHHGHILNILENASSDDSNEEEKQ